MSKDTSERAGALPYTHSIAGCLEGAIGRYGLTRGGAGALARSARAGDRGAAGGLPHAAGCRTCASPRRPPTWRRRRRRSSGSRRAPTPSCSSASAARASAARRWPSSAAGISPAWRREAQRAGRARASTTTSIAVTLEAALASFDLADTRFVVISKSGGTPETLVQALAALGAVKAAGLEKRAPELFLGITEPAVPGKANGLRTLLGGARHPHPRPPSRHRRPLLGVHQRRPAAGHGARARRAGRARRRPRRGRGADGGEVPRAISRPPRGPPIAVGLARERGIRAQVMMPYSDRLGRFGRVVCAAVGREPRQGRAGHRADRLPRPRRPAQPAAALHGRAARAPDQHRAGAVGRAGPAPVGGAGGGGRARLSGRPDRRRPGGGAGAWPCRRRCGRPAGPCAPSTWPGLTSAPSGR